MAKQSEPQGRLSSFELFAGAMLLIAYLLSPLYIRKVFDDITVITHKTISDAWRNIWFYLFFAGAGFLILRYSILDAIGTFFDGLADNLITLPVGMALLCGTNEMTYRLLAVFRHGGTNLNDSVLTAPVGYAPCTNALIALLFAPFIDELLFRGYVFDFLMLKNRVAAYLFSGWLFAFYHAWTQWPLPWSVETLFLALQYFALGLVFCWSHERSDTFWMPFLLHFLANALVLWGI